MKHWTENEFTDWLYGLKSDAAHLEECPDCRAMADSLERRKAEAVRPPEISSDFLAAQRRSVYARLDQPARHWAQSRWMLTLATLILVVVASFGLLRPRQSPAPLASPADEKLFSDLASIEQSNEPRAIKPIESLFEQ